MTKLKTQLENAAEIKATLQRLNIRHTIDDVDVECCVVYLPCSNGVCDTALLFEIIKNGLLTNFALSYSEIQKKLAFAPDDAVEALLNKSIRKLSKKTAHGELGELLLFTILDVYLTAPKILSKISLKTSPRMPVFGADAVHAQYIDGNLRLYLGESKLYKNFNSAKTKALKSIQTSFDQYGQDFDLIESYMDFPEMTPQGQHELIKLLNPFTRDAVFSPDMLYTPCFIGFEDPKLFANNNNYINRYKIVAKSHLDSFYNSAQRVGVSPHKTALLILPFSSIKELVLGFVDYMEIA
ncbi:HamA C-terminal domain-containing protein [Halodesulfovibrio spirochaetisodalis]|uniref:Anti-bacteriophage protein A/HamA C-terminal domain-containing protein n=1 Tax=Halodesulfovibrio spirochaetisodalis TaxID=1560234 RepID=A0A1B7XAA6_9BACT|nr:DUF1837 domain-containing protein [Halodesulfovibrio spirochaetisodalis]OBQ46220.1 hypothetical protein SP90_13560 [Halodesulfovibrio spirochaetisodalis]